METELGSQGKLGSNQEADACCQEWKEQERRSCLYEGRVCRLQEEENRHQQKGEHAQTKIQAEEKFPGGKPVPD